MVDSISQITSALESAKAITFEAAAVATSKLGESSYTHYSKNLSTQQIRSLLNSRNTREVKDAMKRLLSILASDDTSTDIEMFFSDVVKNITSEDIKVKRMVYIYLLRYAEKDPNLALLSVNAIQKTLADSNSDIRTFALRALSDIKIPSLAPIVMLTLKKYMTDPSADVRCEAGYSIMKLYRWKRDELEADILEQFTALMCDSDPRVVSVVLLVFKECFPERLELLHGHYRYYCQIINKLDSWAQAYLVETLIRYCKRYLPKPMVIDPTSAEPEQNKVPLPDNYNQITFPVYELEMHPDLLLFINSIKKLRFSSNPVVILACCNAFYQLTTPHDFRDSGFPKVLIRSATRTTNDGVKTSLLHSVLVYSKLDSTLFLETYRDFLLLPHDNTTIATLKLEILSTLINDTNVELVLRELKKYIKYQNNTQITIAASQTLASCGRLSIALETHIMKWFIKVMENGKSNQPNEVLDCFVNIIRKLVSANPRRHLKIILKLADLLKSNHVTADNARAGIIWLFGEIAGIEFKICPDVLRMLIPNFVYEGPESRMQLILLSAKLASYEIDANRDKPSEEYSIDESRIVKMFKYLVYLGKFDDSYNIRDSVRYLASIFDSGKFEIASLLLQAPKPDVWGNTESDQDVSPIDNMKNVDSDVLLYHNYISWDADVDTLQEGGIDLRESIPTKDYDRFKKSFSSEGYSSPNSRSIAQTSISHQDILQQSEKVSPSGGSNNYTSNTGKKYRLQSLDEFFSDVPERPLAKKSGGVPGKRKVVTVVESSEEESETDSSGEEGTDDEDESSGEENSDTADDASETSTDSEDSGL